MEMAIGDSEEPRTDFIYFISKLRWLKESIYGNPYKVFILQAPIPSTWQRTIFFTQSLKKNCSFTASYLKHTISRRTIQRMFKICIHKELLTVVELGLCQTNW